MGQAGTTRCGKPAAASPPSLQGWSALLLLAGAGNPLLNLPGAWASPGGGTGRMEPMCEQRGAGLVLWYLLSGASRSRLR